MATNNQINTNGGSVICTTTNIGLNNDKLSNILSRTYESAWEDLNKFNFWGCFSIPFSISGTLVVSLLTSDFKAVGPLTADTVSLIAIITCVAFFILGLVMLSVYSKHKGDPMVKQRDVVVKKELDQLIAQNKTTE